MADAGEVLFCFFGWRGQHLGLEFTMYTTTRPSARARPLLPSAMTPPPEIPPPFSPPSTHTCTKIQKFNAFRLRKLRWGAHSARRPNTPVQHRGGVHLPGIGSFLELRSIEFYSSAICHQMTARRMLLAASLVHDFTYSCLPFACLLFMLPLNAERVHGRVHATTER